VIYPDPNPGKETTTLEQRISSNTGFTPLSTFSFLVFTLLYFPCLATVTAIFNETGSWKWSVFSIIMTTGIAWLLSFVVYQTGMIFT
ncbi:MAG TPA: ferrous iron transport protein B, partial [Bacteroidales bacterium]|nr:ferrous iron transport protein B [Bacteroidales bacterium]